MDLGGRADDPVGPTTPAATVGVVVRASFVVGLVGLVLGVGLGRSGSGERIIVADPSPREREVLEQPVGERPKPRKADRRKVTDRVAGLRVPAASWAHRSYRRSLLQAIRKGVVNAVVLDLKDETGTVLYDSEIPLARRVGALHTHFALARAVKQLRGAGVQVIGRVVTFRDPKLAAASTRRGLEARTVLAKNGRPLSHYTNPANPVVRDYYMDIAEEAASMGVDEVLLDHARPPPLGGLSFPGLRGSARDAITSFVQGTKRRLARHSVRLGVSVDGLAATRPAEIDRWIPDLARVSDSIAPTLYPYRWAGGDFGIAWPERRPGQIVRLALRRFLEATEGTGVEVRPWLQDFSVNVRYTSAWVKRQILATGTARTGGWLLWNPDGRYQLEALGAKGST